MRKAQMITPLRAIVLGVILLMALATIGLKLSQKTEETGGALIEPAEQAGASVRWYAECQRLRMLACLDCGSDLEEGKTSNEVGKCFGGESGFIHDKSAKSKPGDSVVLFNCAKSTIEKYHDDYDTAVGWCWHIIYGSCSNDYRSCAGDCEDEKYCYCFRKGIHCIEVTG